MEDSEGTATRCGVALPPHLSKAEGRRARGTLHRNGTTADVLQLLDVLLDPEFSLAQEQTAMGANE